MSSFVPASQEAIRNEWVVPLKSKTGLPRPGFPEGVDLRVEAARSRRRLLPVSILYSALSCGVLSYAVGSGHRSAIGFYVAGALFWTYLEYFAHRYVLHGVFPDGKGLWRQFLHRYFDHLHWQHHARPWDGNHINGTIKDSFPFLALVGGLSLLAPFHTVPVFLAGTIQFYIFEEWVHHSVHFYNFENPYFRYIRKHHLFHHSAQGSEVAYGLSNGAWDVICQTRIDADVRKRLYHS